MGLKQGAIEKTHGECIGNLLEQMKKHKILFAPPPAPNLTKLKRRKTRHLECVPSLPISCMKLLLPKLVGVVFNLV
jgi:hypothetical protein